MTKDLKKYSTIEVRAYSWWYNIPERIARKTMHGTSAKFIAEITSAYMHFIETNRNHNTTPTLNSK